MELLWADLSRNPEQLASPAWHGEVLRSRREQVLQGQASFQSWDAAIGELRAELGGHQAPGRRQGGSPQRLVLLRTPGPGPW
ncbi:MAG: addiction module protein [Cyanobium sp.]